MTSNVNSFWIRYLPAALRKRLSGRHGAQKTIANTGWLVADKILRMGVGVVVGIWVAVYLGPEQFGLFSYAFAFATLFVPVATLGLDGVVVRELVRSPERKNEILGAAFAAKLAGGLSALLLASAGVWLLRPADQLVHWMVVIVASGTLFQSFDTIDFWFQSQVESRFVVSAKNVAFLIVAAIKVALIVAKAPLLAFAAAGSVEIALGAIGLVVAYKMNGQYLSSWSFKAEKLRQLVRESWPLALASMAVMIYMKIDQVMLGQMLGEHEVGVYSAAVRMSEVWYFIPVSIVASVAPSLIQARNRDVALYYQRLSRLFRLLVGMALAIAIPMTFASGPLTAAVYGNAYEGVSKVLAIHIWAAPFVFLGVAQGPWNINEGLMKLALVRTGLGAVSNVVLNLWLIPRYGSVGSAVATAISCALTAVVFNAFSSKTRKILYLQLSAMALLPIRK